MEMTVKSKKRPRPQEKNSLGALGGVYYNYRANGRLITHVIVPRILKSDIRRSYPTMFRNAFNNAQSGVLRSFLNTFCLPDSIFSFRKSAAIQSPSKSMDLQGASVIADFWAAMNEVTPDLVFHMDNTRLKVRSDGTGEVMFQFTFKGTKLVAEDDTSGMKDLDDCSVEMSKLAITAGPKKALPHETIGSGSLHLDANNKIHKFQFDAHTMTVLTA